MKNENSFTKQQFLQLRFSCCPYCSSDKDMVQWYDERSKTKRFICNNCDYYSGEKFIEINWTGEDDD